MPKSALQQILDAPDAAQQAQEILRVLAEEKEKRRAFREWLDEDKKAEFVQGEVILHSPVKGRHWAANGNLTFLLTAYVKSRDLGVIGTEKVLIALERSDYEPDLVYFDKRTSATFIPDQLLYPAPQFIVEILSDSTAALDRGRKKRDYARAGVEEYWIVDPKREIVEVYLKMPHEAVYLPPTTYHGGDSIEARAITGLVLPVGAIFDDAVNRETLPLLLA